MTSKRHHSVPRFYFWSALQEATGYSDFTTLGNRPLRERVPRTHLLNDGSMRQRSAKIRTTQAARRASALVPTLRVFVQPFDVVLCAEIGEQNRGACGSVRLVRRVGIGATAAASATRSMIASPRWHCWRATCSRVAFATPMTTVRSRSKLWSAQ